MNEKEFTAVWSRMDTPPQSGTRCLVTDGDVVVIATYISDSDRTLWLFCGNIADKDAHTFDVQGWMPLPKPIPKLIKVNDENPVAKDKATD